MNSELKESIRDLWKSGLKKEARELYRIAKSLTDDDRNLQERIFSSVLSSFNLSNPRLFIDQKKGIASFIASDMTLTGFPRFLERLLSRLNDEGTRKYELDHIDRTDPMRVYIKM